MRCVHYMFLIVLFVMEYTLCFVSSWRDSHMSAWSLDAHRPPFIFEDEDDSFFMVHSCGTASCDQSIMATAKIFVFNMST
jgi:hypothetical protein